MASLSRSERKRKYGSRWAKWKRAQRAKPTPRGRNPNKVVRHHVGSGDKTVLVSRKRHKASHKKRRDGSAGGRPRKRGR